MPDRSHVRAEFGLNMASRLELYWLELKQQLRLS